MDPASHSFKISRVTTKLGFIQILQRHKVAESAEAGFSVTHRVPELMDGGALGTGIAPSDSRRLILYWWSTPGGRLVFGEGGGWMSRGNRADAWFTVSPLRADR